MRWKPFTAGAVLVAVAFILRGPIQRPKTPELAGGRPIRVEVLNGSGALGIASRFGNLSHFFKGHGGGHQLIK